MLFTSYEFIGFLLLLLILYYAVPGRWQWRVLLAASYLFYFAADPRYLFYILATTVLTYLTARAIEKNAALQKAYLREHKSDLTREEKKAYKREQKVIRSRWQIGCLILVLGILGITKYTNFLVENINDVLKMFGTARQLSSVNLIIPLGISFYTFQSIGYLVDVYRENVQAEKNLFRYALFVSFFPQLIQGPISRFQDLSKTLWKEHRFASDNIRDGLFRVLWGYFKKLVVADRILTAVSMIINDPDAYHGAYTFIVMVFYTIELYADFTGGVDITIGIAQMLGIQIKENFVRPYFSTSLKEYWRRWHISMSTWFKDYVFYPVSVSSMMQHIAKEIRKRLSEKAGKRISVYLSSGIVWLATGIWHGASWNFVIWGLLNWAVLMVSEELEPFYQKFHDRFLVTEKRGYKVFQAGRTFLLVSILNLFDCYEAATDTMRMLGSLFTTWNWGIVADGSLLKLGLTMTDYGILLAGVWVMLFVSLAQRSGSVREKVARMPYFVQAAIWFGLFLAVLLWGNYGIGYDANQFIYNQF